MVLLDVKYRESGMGRKADDSSNVPIGAVDFFLIILFLRLQGVDTEDRSLPWRKKMQHLDLGGAATLIAAVCCLLLALQWGGNIYPWSSSRIVGLFIGFGGLMIVFCILQWRLKEKATVPPRYLRQRSVLMGCCYTFLISVANYAVSDINPLYDCSSLFKRFQGRLLPSILLSSREGHVSDEEWHRLYCTSYS